MAVSCGAIRFAPVKPPGLVPGLRRDREPGEDVCRVAVGREDGVEGLRDLPVADDQGDALVEGHPGDLEGRQFQCCRQLELRIAQQREPEMDALGELGLVSLRLSAQAQNHRAALRELPVQVAEGAALRCAAARAGNQVPAWGERLARLAGSRIDEQDSGPGGAEPRQVDRPTRGRVQGQGRQGAAGEVVARTVVLGDRQVVGEGVDVRLGHSVADRAAPAMMLTKFSRCFVVQHSKAPSQ